MENKYLFRGKAKKTGEWLIGGICERDGRYFIIQTTIYEIDNSKSWGMFEVDPNTICHCTGLIDKYNKLIYEHDYVRTMFGRICEVVWFSSPQHCGWDLIPVANLNHSAPSKNSMWDPEWLIVLGNKFDNHELEKEM